MEDNQIVSLFLRRDERAIAETAAKYGSYCFAIAHNILVNREDAEEAVNDTYLGAWATIPPHKPVVLSTFLGKIARRTALKRWQKNHAQKRGGGEPALVLDELSEYISHSGNAETAVETAELTRLLNRFLRSLPKEERIVFLRRYWYFEPLRDIARQSGSSESRIKSMLSRTRKKLSAYLKKEGIDL